MGAYLERIRRDWAAASTTRRFATVGAAAASIALLAWFIDSGVFARSDVRNAVARLALAFALYVVIRVVKRRHR